MGKDSIMHLRSLSPFERVLALTLALIFFVSAYLSLYQISTMNAKKKASYGGVWREGVFAPASETFNPILAKTALDLDINALVYSGLLRPGKEGFEPDLAESFKISDDGKEYSFTLRDDIYFHDGKKLTSKDVLFTIKNLQDPLSGSPLRAAWEGVNIEIIDDKNFKLILPKPYAPFIENLTLGILPEHLWSSFSAQDMALSIYNKSPVGTGPYKFLEIQDAGSGLRIYKLSANENYYLKKPYIKDFYIYKYPNKADLLLAWSNGEIDAVASLSPELAEKYKDKNSKIMARDFLREFAIFFNTHKNKQILSRKVRAALELAIDKDKLIDTVLHSYGTALYTFLPPYFIDAQDHELSEPERQEMISKIMTDAGWSKNDEALWEKEGKIFELKLSVADSNDELEKVANFLQDELKKYGFKLSFKKYDLATLNNKVIRERDFEALLFGIELGRAPDLYQLWHSSQRDDPGLNISRYNNKKADKILEDLQKETNNQKQKELVQELNKLILEDRPAIFLFSPKFIYLSRNNLQGVSLSPITKAHERFTDVNEWFVNSQLLWNIFK